MCAAGTRGKLLAPAVKLNTDPAYSRGRVRAVNRKTTMRPLPATIARRGSMTAVKRQYATQPTTKATPISGEMRTLTEPSAATTRIVHADPPGRLIRRCATTTLTYGGRYRTRLPLSPIYGTRPAAPRRQNAISFRSLGRTVWLSRSRIIHTPSTLQTKYER